MTLFLISIGLVPTAWFVGQAIGWVLVKVFG